MKSLFDIYKSEKKKEEEERRKAQELAKLEAQRKRKKLLSTISLIIQWLITVYLVIFAVASFTITSNLLSKMLFILMPIMACPIGPIRNGLLGRVKFKTLISYLAVIVFLFAGALSATTDIKPTYKDSQASGIKNEVKEDTSNVENVVVADNTVNKETDVVETEADNTVETDNSETTITEDMSEPIVLSDDSTFNIHFIDVGQADSALIECDGHYMLIDGGNVADSSKIYTVLKNSNISSLDIVVGTHAHEDHIGGLAGALNYSTADLVLCTTDTYNSEAFDNFKKYADLNGGGITIPLKDDEYQLGSASVKVLSCSNEYNNDSIVLLITYGDTRFLFTGDMEYQTEYLICDDYNEELPVNLLKVGHHGSDTSTSYRFLRMLMPEYAVISVGTGNSYGHPTDSVLSRLEDAEVKTYRTDLNGDIYVTSDGTTVTVSATKETTEEESYKAADTYPVSLELYVNNASYSSGYWQLYLGSSYSTYVKILPEDATNKNLTYKSDNTNVIEVDSNGNLKAIAEGTAKVTVKSENDVSDYVEIRVSKKQVQSSGTTTSGQGVTPPASTGSEARAYVLNTNTKKFHYPTCNSLPTQNRSDVTTTREELIAQNYVPCKKCNP